MIKILRSRGFIITAGLVLLLALIWVVLGLLVGLSAIVCLLATCGLLILFSGYLLFDQARAAKNASNLERSIFEQTEEQKASARPEKREEIENLRQQLVASIQKLKKSRLGQGRKGAAALYALPWYMIIGPPAAGKTTAIRNSGLEFPFGTDREIQGVGGTRNCDWWFSNSAIILDTAGRYVTEEDDQEEWTAFLDILRKNRSRQPINGVLFCISVADLLNATRDETEWHARTIRKRIDELTTRLGLRFPVYLLFTKCDLFNGFVQFFEEFNRAQREQIWGCTFGPDQRDDREPAALFEREYQTLYDGLISARFARLAPGIKREDRSVIYAFPMEFLAAKENLSFFVKRVFQPNPYQESPAFRGFYFTSGTQEGVPIDRVIQTMAQAFGLSPQAKQELNPEIQAKSYFIKDLFTEVIIPDAHLVRPTSHAARSRRLFRVGAGAVTVLLLAIAILGMTQAYFRSKARLDAAAADVSAFKASSLDAADLAPRLDVLLKRIQILQDPPFFVFGMDKSKSLLPSMEQLYFRQIHPFVYAGVLQPLGQHLAASGPSRS
ncbi:MAG TPA: type VI secretion system membrane subunit TssM, partial [Bacteroidota bacterium]